MSQSRSDLEAEKAKHEADIAVYEKVPDAKKTPRQWKSLAINQRSLLGTIAKLAVNIEPPTAPPVTPPADADPYPGKSMADRRRAWDGAEAEDQIHGVYERAGLGQSATPAARIAALGPGLAGKAVALTQFGFPGETPGVDYSLADKFGGVWGVQNVGDSGDFHVRVWHASTVAHDHATPSPELDWARIGREHGLDASTHRPADDYQGEFNAPVDF